MFKTPFQVHDSVIYDADGKKVKLFGVNYYTPFNCNFLNIEELGKDHFAAIDEDIQQFKLLGIDFVRIHIYDREITNRRGHVVENKRLEVFDYFVEQCAQNGIYLMLAMCAWWTPLSNQTTMEKNYAYWYTDEYDAFGFSNFFSADSLLWNQDAIDCQKVYYHEFFSRRNKFSSKTLPEYANLVAMELMNETPYLRLDFVKNPPEPNWMSATQWSRGKLHEQLLGMWEEFKNVHPGETEEQCFELFNTAILENYFSCLWGIINQYFGGNTLKCQFSGHGGRLHSPTLRAAFKKAGIQVLAVGTYLNPCGFDGTNTNSENHLEIATRWFENWQDAPRDPDFARVSYEYNASGAQTGYSLAVIAAMYAKYDVQMTAMFTYTPTAIAAWNPGWVGHYLNLLHTPSRAAGFKAAGEFFRRHDFGEPIQFEPEAWYGSDYRIERKNDLVCSLGDRKFTYSNSNEYPVQFNELDEVFGRGNSQLVECSSNSCYLLRRLAANEWQLELFPDQQYVKEPTHGKTYLRDVSSRYINCLETTPVSILRENRIKFKFRLTATLEIRSGSDIISPAADGSYELKPGTYHVSLN